MRQRQRTQEDARKHEAERNRTLLAVLITAASGLLGAIVVSVTDISVPTTIVAAAIVSSVPIVVELLRPLARRVLRSAGFTLAEQPKAMEYSAKLHRLMEALRESSREVDSVLGELATFAAERERSVHALEAQLFDLASREQELQQRINDLKKVPVPVAEHFAALTAAGEQRSARRDYMLFGLGVIVSTIVSIIFFFLQGS